MFTMCNFCDIVVNIIAPQQINDKENIVKDRFVMRFTGKMTTFAEDDLNKFLDANPDYRLVCMTYAHQSSFYYGIIAYFEKIK